MKLTFLDEIEDSVVTMNDVILIKSDDDDAMPKSPIYLSDKSTIHSDVAEFNPTPPPPSDDHDHSFPAITRLPDFDLVPSDLVPNDIADEISREIKKSGRPVGGFGTTTWGSPPPESSIGFQPVTSRDVRGWAVDHQTADLEDGEIIDDDVICVDNNNKNVTRRQNGHARKRNRRNRKVKIHPGVKNKKQRIEPKRDWIRHVDVRKTHPNRDEDDYS